MDGIAHDHHRLVTARILYGQHYLSAKNPTALPVPFPYIGAPLAQYYFKDIIGGFLVQEGVTIDGIVTSSDSPRPNARWMAALSRKPYLDIAEDSFSGKRLLLFEDIIIDPKEQLEAMDIVASDGGLVAACASIIAADSVSAAAISARCKYLQLTDIDALQHVKKHEDVGLLVM